MTDMTQHPDMPASAPGRRSHRSLYYAVVGSMMAMGAACNGPNPCAVKRACGACAPRSSMQACAPRNPCAARRTCAPRGCNPCAPRGCAPRGCNPCAPKGCGPCAPMGACGPCGPCGAADIAASDFVRPSGYCAPSDLSSAALIEEGRALWNDPSIGESGLSCQSCHMGGANLNPSFAQAYPHQVAMPMQMAGVSAVHADEMVQFCMVVPMQSEPLSWDSRELQALTAYTVHLQEDFEAPCGPVTMGCGPCGACNPCAPRGCGPCAPRGCGPCAPRGCNPCAPRGCGPRGCGISAVDSQRPASAMNPMPVKRQAA